MINVEKNKQLFKKMYEYYKERINTVTYPKYELEKLTTQEKNKYKNLSETEILKTIRTKLLDQKYNHSLRVEKITEQLNKTMDNNKEFESISNTAGLLHDYGRFMQAVLFNNFKEAEDFFKDNGLSGHGEVGSRILFINDEIRNFEIDKKYHEILNKVIEKHSLPTLGNYNKKIDENFKNKTLLDKDLIISCALQMVKDADMCDILYQRITGEYPVLSTTFRYKTNNQTLKEIEQITGVDIDTILTLNKIEKEIPKTIILPLEQVNTNLLEVPQEIKEKFYNKIYMTNTKEWDLRTMQNDKRFNYNSITAMWWSIGQFLGNMNFTATLEVLNKNKILEQIYNQYPEKYKYLVKEMFEFAEEELLEKRIKEKNIYAKTYIK